MPLDTSFIEDLPPGPLDNYRKLATFDWKSMKLFFENPDLLKLKMKVWDTLEKDPIFRRSEKILSTEEMKRITALQLRNYCKFSFLVPEIAQLSYKQKSKYMMTVNEALAVTFPDVSVKHAIGVSLFKNTVTTLGTARHQHILDAAWQGKILSCLALTELAHGSNTKQTRTTATYDKTTEEFIIHTPDFEAAKFWVGNLGYTCTVALVFAQLHTNGHCYGLHAFIVPIRDPHTLQTYEGLVVGDMGEKIGLHGIDNGYIVFNHYRIPRENLLNRTGDVAPDGTYQSSFSEPGKVLGAALENLSMGRLGIMQESVNNLICAVSIAIRYAALRKQFADKSNNEEEVPIMEYQLHQVRLFPFVASAVVLRVFVSSFTEDYLKGVEKSTSTTDLGDVTSIIAEIHAIISSAKPLLTWTCRDAVQECREACGGHGFLKAARFGDLRGAVDPTVTYEGDNNVLNQQASNWLLRQWEKMENGETELCSPYGSCEFFKDHRNILDRKFVGRQLEDILSLTFIHRCYEWLITYLTRQTFHRQQDLKKLGQCKIQVRNNTQAYWSATLTKVFVEYLAFKYYCKELVKSDPTFRDILIEVGVLYGLWNIQRSSVYFYQGGFTADPNFSEFLMDGILKQCCQLKNNIVTIVDALAPPDYVLNSVLGRSDGQLYENLKNVVMADPKARCRPSWWQEIIVPGTPDLKNWKSFKSKL